MMDDCKNALKCSFREFLKNNLIPTYDKCKEKRFFDAFAKHFNNRSDLNTLLGTLKKEEKNKIIGLGFFYTIITKDIKFPGVILIGIFSIMEATALNKFRTFDQWLLAKIKQGQNISFPITDKKCFKKSIISFQKEYFKEHGSTERVRNFINKYFYTKDKQRLAKAFVIKGETIAINKVINMLYNERSAFVHMARFPQISENGKKMIGCFNINGKDIIVNINISINTIQEMFEKAFIKFIRARCV